MPTHLEVTGSLKANRQTSVLFGFGDLVRVKLKPRRAFGGIGSKAPDDLPIFRVVMVRSKRPHRVILEIEIGRVREALYSNFGRDNVIDTIVTEASVALVNIDTDEIPAWSQQ